MNASAHIVEIDDSNAQQLLIEESMARPVVVDFWADWCAPCKQLTPILESLVKSYKGQLKLVKIDTEKNQELAKQNEIKENVDAEGSKI